MYNIAYHNQPIENLSFLITGGAGFIGSHLAEYLMLFGARRVRVLDDYSTGLPSNIEYLRKYPQFEFMEGTMADPETCRKACEGMDIISHQGAIGSVPRSIKEPHVSTLANITGFVNMVVAARDAGICRFVYASSSSVYGSDTTLPKLESRIGKPLSPYAITKLTNEVFAENFGTLYDMEFIGLRYFNVFGPRQNPQGVYAAVIPIFSTFCFHNEPCYINGDGTQSRDFTYIENVVQMNTLAMLTQNPKAVNQVYNVGCGDKISVNGLFELIRDIAGSESVSIHRDPRPGDIKDSLADVSKAMTLLNYNPAIRLREGLERTVPSYRPA